MSDVFRRFAQGVSRVAGHALAFTLAAVIIVIWIASGPLFGFSDTWQLVINTGTTIVTFLMVFILQNTQNRDNTAVQLKLDELVRAIRNARTSFVDIEELPDEQLDVLEAEFRAMHVRAQEERETRGRRRESSVRAGS